MPNTQFTKVDYALGSLIDAIGNGQIGLPDIQRPFVWKNVKVRELFDSMYRGYPVGYLLFGKQASDLVLDKSARMKSNLPRTE